MLITKPGTVACGCKWYKSYCFIIIISVRPLMFTQRIWKSLNVNAHTVHPFFFSFFILLHKTHTQHNTHRKPNKEKHFHFNSPLLFYADNKVSSTTTFIA